MFYYNTSMKGSVPEFNSSVHTVLNTVAGYLTSVSEGNITNSSKLEQRLIPRIITQAKKVGVTPRYFLF